MTHAAEKFIMDPATTTTRDKERISVSRNLVLLLVLIFVSCIVATGLLVYHFSSCSRHVPVEKLPEENIQAVRDEESVSKEVPLTPLPSSSFAETSEPAGITTEAVTVHTQTESKTEEILDVRLPRSVIPHSYKLKLMPFLIEGNFTFHGEVTILVNVTEDTSNITLHADELEILESSVNIYDNSPNFINIPVLDITLDPKLHFLIIELNGTLKESQQYYVNIKFKGVLNDLLQGFYRSSYKEGNETRWIAATQFQPTDARVAFPCFDEPALKARFKLSIARPRHLHSISNMPKVGKAEKVDGVEDYFWDHFQETVPMSTYLLAFVVSDFESISNGSFSVWARSGALSQSKFSLQLGPDMLKFYEKYFDIAFPLPKIDMVALPDFSGGAMENWGLITYRETLLLHQDGVSGKSTLQSIATVLAHELAHQWFGNLVTPTWWTDLWLNEGFATYMEYVCTNAIKPEWHVLDQFVTNELQFVFGMDALKSSHQISIEVNNTDEINDIFDKISYSKGATVIRMMDNFLTTKVFRKGLSSFLKSRKYGNAAQDYLWEKLTEEAHKSGVLDPTMNIKEIMDTWTLLTGFPVVNATRTYRNGTLTLTQSRFVLGGSRRGSKDQLWWIPVTYTGRNADVKTVWMKAEEKLVVSGLKLTSNEWLLVNVNQTGYYRVNYDDRNWRMLAYQLRKPLGHLVFDVKNRAQMVDDAMNLAAAGHLSYHTALNITKYLSQERDYVPWKAALRNFDYITAMFIRTGKFDKLKSYLLNLIEGFYNHLSFKDSPTDSQLDIYSRTDVLWRACLLELKDCIVNAVRQFENWRSTPDPDKNNPISQNLRGVVYCTAIRVGGQEHWEFAWERYKATNVMSEKATLLAALGCSRETWILSRYLEWAITENSGIRKQDSARVFQSVTFSDVGHHLSFRFLRSNWEKIRTYMGPQSSMLIGVVHSCTLRLNTREEVDELIQFAKSKSSELGVVNRTVQLAIEDGEANINWMEKNFDSIVQWLSRTSF